MKQRFNNNALLTGMALLAAGASAVYAETPYQGTLYAAIAPKPGDAGTELFLNFPAVPAGKRLMIEHVGLRASVNSGDTLSCALSATQPQAPGMGFAQYYLAKPEVQYTNSQNRTDFVGIDEKVKLFVDGGAASALTLHCSRIPTSSGGGGGAGGAAGSTWMTLITVVGHLDDIAGQ